MTSAVTNSTHFSGEMPPGTLQTVNTPSKDSQRKWTNEHPKYLYCGLPPVNKLGMLIAPIKSQWRSSPLLGLGCQTGSLAFPVNFNHYRSAETLIDRHNVTKLEVTKLESVLKLTRIIAEYAEVQIGANRLIAECLGHHEQYGLIRV